VFQRIEVCVDDERNLGDVNIRNPVAALGVLRKLLPGISRIYWDNDMGYGWEYEGRNLLKSFMEDCKRTNLFPVVSIVTANPIAAEDMCKTLEAAGYKGSPDRKNWAKYGTPDSN